MLAEQRQDSQKQGSSSAPLLCQAATQKGSSSRPGSEVCNAVSVIFVSMLLVAAGTGHKENTQVGWFHMHPVGWAAGLHCNCTWALAITSGILYMCIIICHQLHAAVCSSVPRIP